MKITNENRPRPHLYSTDMGGNPVLPNPDDPPPPADEVDVALDADAFVPIAAADEASVVQFKNATAALSGNTVTLDAAPTPGNILVCFYSSRSGSGADQVTGPFGWTAHADSPVYGGTLIGGAPGCPTFAWWHVVETGEGSTVTVQQGGDAGNPTNITVVELAGVGTLIDEPSANQQTGTDAKLTGVVGSNDAIVLVGFDVQQDGGLAYTPDSGSTELVDEDVGGSEWPHQWVGYRIVTSGAGSYDVGATGAFSLPWGALGFAFDTGGTGVSQQVAPLTVDADDATFNESELEEIVRLDIGAAQRLTSSRLLVGYDSSGSRTVHLWAGNASDLSDAVEVDAQTFTATGGGTGDDVTFAIADTTAYRYWEFRGPTEHTKTYTVEMFAFQQSFDLSGYQLLSEKGDPNGYASLTADGLVPDAQIADGSASDGDVPISNGDGTRTWGAMAGGGGTPSDTVTDETLYDITPDAGVASEYSRGDHTHGSPPTPTGGVTEITDLPTAETDTSLVLAPDGVGGVEWRAESGGGGGGGMLAPVVVQAKGSQGLNTTNPAVTFANAPGTDNIIVVGVNLVGRGVSSISCTNCTFTKVVDFTSGGGSHYEIWVGKPTGGTAPGSTVTVNTGSSNFSSVEIMEIVATVTPTAGATYGAQLDYFGTTAQFGPLAVTAGRLVVLFAGADNTSNPVAMSCFMPAYVHAQMANGTGCALAVGYASVGSAGAMLSPIGSAGVGLIAEVT